MAGNLQLNALALRDELINLSFLEKINICAFFLKVHIERLPPGRLASLILQVHPQKTRKYPKNIEGGECFRKPREDKTGLFYELFSTSSPLVSKLGLS